MTPTVAVGTHFVTLFFEVVVPASNHNTWLPKSSLEYSCTFLKILITILLLCSVLQLINQRFWVRSRLQHRNKLDLVHVWRHFRWEALEYILDVHQKVLLLKTKQPSSKSQTNKTVLLLTGELFNELDIWLTAILECVRRQQCPGKQFHRDQCWWKSWTFYRHK